ncbi:type I restriction-modification system methyltransferase subunit [Owenweeksia hongkongensis DSM 17368]|uniref:site-specific DNA-methyltransferase (adenine-specific) n=1 Tax=Owenweeksia hongkongensis (strain DSM 17368 / CIP 108786 / JCM 12287 / NRRL B-23963 / UST20020801) TaxID=926562 RepID=G8QZQ3_OWEHD|nr:DNA methyltransferase [Owenweeksia hongkongensis]AEV31497.1 type I restriction-modification system methyltransferase subunit [Owenweeksia hongkongensis DSM 17368]
MALFQTKVLKDYLDKQDSKAIDKAYRTFTAYFQNSEVQRNIRSSKEEQFQATFLSKLFVDALGYTLFPDPKYNLTTEHKNETGAQKADGAILAGAKGGGGKAVAVIELKSTKTKDLESIRKQAFDYKANHTDCRYVITSNFEKLRFYINDAVEWLEFDLFHLSPADFATLYLCLHKNNLLNDVPQKVKDDSLVQEEKITKQLYKDYSLFRMELYRDLVKRNRRNPQLKELSEKSIKFTLFKKAQKLLDRFLFIFFAEDRGLIPRNMVVKINEEWKQLQNMQVDQSLYERYKIYFTNLDKGNPKHDIFAYNGGLFLPDPVLDTIEIDDDLLFKHTTTLTAYDFESEVDVNILGHIFENSLNEIESVAAEIEGVDFDKQKARRKKDGVFYTPKYITKYIVDNTLGKLCDEKKKELEITAEVYENAKQRSKKRLNNLQLYRDWLLQLTICDPACGSGAFLNQALEFLIAEHRYLDELSATYNKDALVLSDIENSILENNLYGVDLNQESVEIAKLSLWLRTAQRGRKLTSLSSNIKCGNSLIDAVKVAGDKAFKWEKEFPQVFAKGGFDVVIGNPPYVRQELLGDFKEYFEKTYKVFEGTSDLFAYFYEKGFAILKPSGQFGFISNTFDKTKAAVKLRSYLQSQVTFNSYIDFTEVQIFEGATTYPIILIAQNSAPKKQVFTYRKIKKAQVSEIVSNHAIEVDQFSLTEDSWSFNSVALATIIDKLKLHSTIRSTISKCFYGIKTGFNEAFIIDLVTKKKLEEEHSSSSELIKPFFEGKDLTKWHSAEIDKFLIFTRRGTIIEDFPAIKTYLEQFKERLTPRNSPEIKVGRKAGPYKWFEIQDSVDYYKKFEAGKITWPNLQNRSKFSLDLSGYYINAPSVILPSDSKALLCIINSKLIWEFLKSICVVRSGGYIEVKPQYFEQIPIPPLANEAQFEERCDQIIVNTETIQQTQQSLLQVLTNRYPMEKLSGKLQNWPSLDFKGFLKELQKAKVKLSLAEEAEWMPYFNQQKQQVQALQAQIDTLDKEIDQMVYALYGLTEEEIEVVENS